MDNLLIKTLFEEIRQSDEYYDSPEMSEAQKIVHKSDEALEELLGDLFREADELITRQLVAYETAALIIGFKTAMRLVAESYNFSFPKGGVAI